MLYVLSHQGLVASSSCLLKLLFFDSDGSSFPCVRENCFFPIKKHWFDLILAGEKTVEFRAVNDYWTSRLAGATIAKFVNSNRNSPLAPTIMAEILEIKRLKVSEIPAGLAPPAGSVEHSNMFKDLCFVYAIYLGDITSRRNIPKSPCPSGESPSFTLVLESDDDPTVVEHKCVDDRDCEERAPQCLRFRYLKKMAPRATDKVPSSKFRYAKMNRDMMLAEDSYSDTLDVLRPITKRSVFNRLLAKNCRERKCQGAAMPMRKTYKTNVYKRPMQLEQADGMKKA